MVPVLGYAVGRKFPEVFPWTRAESKRRLEVAVLPQSGNLTEHPIN